MRSAVIVSTARTPIGRAYRGAFNNTPSPTLSAYSIRAAVERAGIDPAEVDDLCWGASIQQGGQSGNTARCALLLPCLAARVAAAALVVLRPVPLDDPRYPTVANARTATRQAHTERRAEARSGRTSL
jgi:hypothetical protein